MVRQHVAECARLLVELAAPFDAKRLGRRDLHVVDVLAPPHGLEHRIRETHGKDALHGVLAEKVIDAIDLRFVCVTQYVRIEIARGREVRAERLFDHETPEAPFALRVFFQQAKLAETFDDRPEKAGAHREVEDRIAVRRFLDALLERFECIVGFEFARHVFHAR